MTSAPPAPWPVKVCKVVLRGIGESPTSSAEDGLGDDDDDDGDDDEDGLGDDDYRHDES